MMPEVAAGLSQESDPRSAAIAAAMEARGRLGGKPSLAVVFASPAFAAHAEAVLDAIHEGAGPSSLIGCISESVVGGGREVENGPAVSVLLARVPAEVQTFHVRFSGTETEHDFHGWPDGLVGPILLLADPFTFPAELLLRRIHAQQPGTIIVGGMASGADAPGKTRLFHDTRVVTAGAVGMHVPDGLDILPVVSQGCRPVGNAFTVTRADANLILELGGKPPVERLRELFDSLTAREQEQIQGGLLLGRAIDEYKTELGRGDFLIRAVLGADPESGAIAVGDAIQVGETVQFHVRDADSAGDDLRAVLEGATKILGGRAVAGALLFTCNGRGTRMFPTPDHDASTIVGTLGGIPLAGSSCAGEIGPVGNKTFLHGFTASMALLVPRVTET